MKVKITSQLREQMRCEHEQLRELLSDIDRCLVERSETGPQVVKMMGSLRDHVATHFADEEAAGLFDQIIEQAPRLAESVEELRAEHLQLLERVGRLKDLAATGEGTASWWQQLQEEFRDFSKILMRHETRENELLLDAFDQDIGSQD